MLRTERSHPDAPGELNPKAETLAAQVDTVVAGADACCTSVVGNSTVWVFVKRRGAFEVAIWARISH
jgi:hypothetical protein